MWLKTVSTSSATRLKRPIRGSHFYWALANLASSLTHLGRIDEARATLDDLMRRRPDFSRDLVDRILPWADAAAKECYLEGLRKARLPV